MENASKALIMAGGILIGIIILGLFAYEMSSIAQTGKTYQEQIDKEAITEFNAQFEQYTGKDLTAQEVVTIYSYVIEWNLNNEWAKIEMVIKGLNQIEIKNYLAKVSDIDKADDIEGFLNKYSFDIDKGKYKYFTLTIDSYNNDNQGRVSKITIKEK